MFGSRTTTTSNFKSTAEKIYRWKSPIHNFVTWDKDNNVEVELAKGTKLVPLTATMSVTGVHERDHNKATRRYNQVYSNEFTNTKTDIVKVVEKDKNDGTKTVIAEGVYNPTVKDIIGDLPYARFTKNLYCLEGDTIVKVVLTGASLSPWIEFENGMKGLGYDMFDHSCFYVSGYTDEKNGSVSYTAPKFTRESITDDINEKANQAAIAVEDAIIHNKQVSGTEETPTVVSNKPAEPAVVEEPISLDEIPF